MKKCPYCGRDNEDTANACGHCYAGFPVEKPVKQPVKAEKAEKAEKKPDKE